MHRTLFLSMLCLAGTVAAQGERLLVSRINPYLVDAPDVVITRRSGPL